MSALNKVMLIGNLGDDPEVRHFENGGQITKISLATTEKYNDKEGNKQEVTDWHRIEFTGKVAEIAEKYLSKGSKVYVEGKLKKDTWETDNGEKRSLVKVRAFNLVMLGGKPESESSPAKEEPKQDNSGGGEEGTDDLPF